MSPCYQDCTICGVRIYDRRLGYPRPWMCKYRAIYHDGVEARLTGLDFLEDTEIYEPPRSSLERWNKHQGTIELSVMAFQDYGYPHGFVFHESCWQLLQKASEPKAINLNRFLEVCQSLPFPSLKIYWGHSFEVVSPLDTHDAYQWQESLAYNPNPESRFEFVAEDPFNVPEVPRILSVKHNPHDSKPLIKQSRDCFDSLPTELKDRIAISLPTEDALNLSLASASFLYIRANDHFWASRFSADGERGFIFEATEHRRRRDWLSLYRSFGPLRCTSGLRNRRRVWHLAKLIANIIQRHRVDTTPTAIDTMSTQADMSWVSCEILLEQAETEYASGFSKGCRSFGTCTVVVPTDLNQIGITLVKVGVMTYVTGIRLIAQDKLSTRIGYVVEQQEQILHIRRFHGFRVALSRNGIQALQVVGESGYTSPWVGNTTEMLLSNNAIKSTSVQWLAASYDGFKLVRIGIDKSGVESAQALEASSLLRRAPWYPDVPHEQAVLEPDNRCLSVLSKLDFVPFVYLDFGGLKGEYLSSITGISVHWGLGPKVIKVLYGDRNESCSKQLGRGGYPSKVDVYPLFPIDGASGELLTAIDVAIDVSCEKRNYPVMSPTEGIRFITNWGRKSEAGSFGTDYEVRRLVAAGSRVMTGIYTTLDKYDCLCELGLVSAALDSKR